MQLLNLSAIAKPITHDDLEALTRDNPDARLETNSQGQLIIMSPTGGETGNRNTNLAAQIWNWNRQSKLGKVFDSSTGFILSNGAVRSPDVSWFPISKWNSLSTKQRRKYLPVDPDFVIELMSPICEAVSFRTDYLSDTQQKMSEYMDCGVRLGWLINPDEKQVEIYRQGKDKEILDEPKTLSGEDIMPGLVLDLEEIFI